MSTGITIPLAIDVLAHVNSEYEVTDLPILISKQIVCQLGAYLNDVLVSDEVSRFLMLTIIHTRNTITTF